MSKGYMHSPDSHAMHALRWHLPKQQQIPKTFQSKIPFPCRPSCLLELSTAGMLFNCFTSPASSHGPKEAHKEDDLRYEIRRIRSKEAFERTIQRANARGVQVLIARIYVSAPNAPKKGKTPRLLSAERGLGSYLTL